MWVDTRVFFGSFVSLFMWKTTLLQVDVQRVPIFSLSPDPPVESSKLLLYCTIYYIDNTVVVWVNWTRNGIDHYYALRDVLDRQERFHVFSPYTPLNPYVTWPMATEATKAGEFFVQILEFSKFTCHHSGIYTVTVQYTDTVPNITNPISRRVTAGFDCFIKQVNLTLNQKPERRKRVIFTHGAAIELSCRVAAFPVPIYTWLYTENGTEHRGVNTPDIRIVANTSNQYTYRCEALYTKTNEKVISESLELAIEEVLHSPELRFNSTIVGPATAAQKFHVGRVIELECSSDFHKGVFLWHHDSSVLADNGNATYILIVDVHSSGYYRCSIVFTSQANRRYTLSSPEFHVEVITVAPLWDPRNVLYVIVPLGVIAFLGVVLACYVMKRNARRREEKAQEDLLKKQQEEEYWAAQMRDYDAAAQAYAHNIAMGQARRVSVTRDTRDGYQPWKLHDDSQQWSTEEQRQSLFGKDEVTMPTDPLHIPGRGAAIQRHLAGPFQSTTGPDELGVSRQKYLADVHSHDPGDMPLPQQSSGTAAATRSSSHPSGTYGSTDELTYTKQFPSSSSSPRKTFGKSRGRTSDERTHRKNRHRGRTGEGRSIDGKKRRRHRKTICEEIPIGQQTTWMGEIDISETRIQRRMKRAGRSGNRLTYNQDSEPSVSIFTRAVDPGTEHERVFDEMQQRRQRNIDADDSYTQCTVPSDDSHARRHLRRLSLDAYDLVMPVSSRSSYTPQPRRSHTDPTSVSVSFATHVPLDTQI